jgi:UDP-N-acetylmuramoyl-tripeptide--D-alanyl-D-alanine ligase
MDINTDTLDMDTINADTTNTHRRELSLNLLQVSDEVEADVANYVAAYVAGSSELENKKLLEEQFFTSLSIDSRTIKKGDLYIAIRGDRCDGHDYINQAIEKGAIACVVDHKIDELEQIKQIVVKDCKLALGKIASLWIQQWKELDLTGNKVIGITGSCGKTTVKEMLRAILVQEEDEQSLSVLSTQGNLNNEYGVPLTIMQLKAKHKVAIIEMGANHQQEIDYLTSIAKPNIAIVTNAGSAHVEGFGSLEGVAKGKGEIYSSLSEDGIAIINNDDKYADYWKKLVSEKKVKIITFAINNEASLRAKKIGVKEKNSNGDNQWAIKTPSGDFNLNLPVLGRHNLANALAAISVGQLMKISNRQIKNRLENFKNISGRLEKSQKQKTFILINDSYNANPESVKAAIDILSTSKASKKVLILGDMGELGNNEVSLHEQVGKYAAVQDINQFYTVGKLSKHSIEAYVNNIPKDSKDKNTDFKKIAKNFGTVDDLIKSIDGFDLKEAMVIVKGSRKMAMENVFYALEKIA